ncbi:MAG TPA: transposase [Pyrinomonadaceae bacterium]|nr:transposase [Pyrinomonadaceae bacterium]
MSIRETKGRQLADTVNVRRHGNLWVVPSQTGKGKYTVDAKVQRCTCPDFDFRRQPCKHIYAVQVTIEREQTTVTETHADGSTTTTTTEAVKVTRKTYRQAWPSYNRAQTQEKAQFLYLLHKLCQGVGSPGQVTGRPRYMLEDMIFAMAFKVYSIVSGRRFMSDLRDSHARGYLSALPSYNTVFRYFESETLTPYLKMLIEESSLPLRAIEQDFAVDSTGISTCRFVRWYQAKYGWDFETGMMVEGQTVEKKDWVKLHLMCGVKTNVVTSVEVTDRNAADTTYFKPLVDATAENFTMRQVSADKAYLSLGNLRHVSERQAMPYIPFKGDSKPTHSLDKTGLWRQMYHYYAFNHDRFAANYHKRSNVETTFMMIKTKFGDALRSKSRTAQINETLCKVLCHNICCLIQSMFELGLRPKFWNEVAA